MSSPHTPPPNPARRRFLTRTAAAGALALGGSGLSCATTGAAQAAWDERLRPVKANPKVNQLAPDQPIRLALIGSGGMGGGHLDALLSYRERGEEKLELVAVAEVCKPRLDTGVEKCRKRQPGVEVQGYRDYRELLARGDLHGVVVASPEHWHAKHSVEAMQAGLDVYCEKPLTRHLVDALWMQRQTRAGAQILQVGTQYMMKTDHNKAKELIRAGAIGQPTWSQTSYCRNSKNGEWLYGIDKNVAPGAMLDWEAWCGPEGVDEWDTEVYHRWRRYKKWSTGIIGDLLVHQMTPLLYAMDLGAPTRVVASGGHLVDKAMENHDQVNLLLEFSDEQGNQIHQMSIAGSTCNDRGFDTIIRGHEADLLLGNESKLVLKPQSPFVDDVDPQEFPCETGDWQDALRKDWLACIRSRRPNRSQIDLGVAHMVAVELATRSIWERSAFTYDPRSQAVRAV